MNDATHRHSEDQGVAFGKWQDDTSRLLYQDIMPIALNSVDTSGRVADYGGANGLLKDFIPHAISVDYDASKSPDVVANIAAHVGEYDLIVLRYVLHYMSDVAARKLFAHIATYHKGEVLIIQFCNDDKKAKESNSVNETKWFRTTAETRTLLSTCRLVPSSVKVLDYTVKADFYARRLDNPNGFAHDEKILMMKARFA